MKVSYQVISWAISRQAALLGKEDQADQMIDEALTILKKVVQMQEEVNKL